MVPKSYANYWLQLPIGRIDEFQIMVKQME